MEQVPRITYFDQELRRIRDRYYPKNEVCRRVILGKDFIDSHFRDPITLEEVASAACLSVFHFMRLFKKLYGRTALGYIHERRIREAKRLLEQGCPVWETCYRVGFSSPTSFSAFFRHHTRHSPAAFSKKAGIKRFPKG